MYPVGVGYISTSDKSGQKRKRVSARQRDIGTGRCRHSLLRHCRCPEAMQPSSDIMSALSGVARDINSLDASYLHLVVGVVDTAFVCTGFV